MAKLLFQNFETNTEDDYEYEKSIIDEEDIKYKKWVGTDRCELVMKRYTKSNTLSPHLYICRELSKIVEEYLTTEETVVLLD